MSQKFQEKVQELFESTKDLQSLEAMQPYIDEFNIWINEQNYTVGTLGKNLSKYKFHQLFKSIDLQQGQNAESVPKHDGQGNITGYELKHYVLIHCGLTSEQWTKRNNTNRVTERLSAIDENGNNGTEINPDEYLEVTGKLLASDDAYEVAVGLIAATGRRPIEILARGNFSIIENEEYKLNFDGQVKKRGKKPVFKISTLYPASYILERFNWLRNDSSIKSFVNQVIKEFPDDELKQNEAIENGRGNSLRRVVRNAFESFLTVREGKNDNNSTGLRAACACLVTERDCIGSVGSKMLFYGKFLGHITPNEKLSDRDLNHLVTSLGYADYYCIKPVIKPVVEKQFSSEELAEMWDKEIDELEEQSTESDSEEIVITSNNTETVEPVEVVETKKKSKLESIKVHPENRDNLNNLKNELNLNSYDAVISLLIETWNNQKTVEQEKINLQNKVDELSEQLEVKENVEIIETTEELKTMEITTELEQLINDKFKVLESLIDIKIQSAISSTEKSVNNDNQSVVSNNKSEKQDFSNIPYSGLLELKSSDAVDEKMLRAFNAIKAWNHDQAEQDNRIAITNTVFRELTASHSNVITKWIDQHKDEIISHNAQYSMAGKDLQSPVTYYNKKLGEIGKNRIIAQIKEHYLK